MISAFSQQTLDAIASNDPSWLRSQRLAAWQCYEKLPLPSRRDVDWQRFDLRALDLQAISDGFNETAAIEETLTPLPPELAKQGVIFCTMATALSKHSDLLKQYLGTCITPEEPLKFYALHAALWRPGALLYVPREVRITVPLEITYTFNGKNTAGFPRTLVVIEPAAEATLVQKFIGGPGRRETLARNGTAALHASGTEVIVKHGGRLHYISCQNFQPGVLDFTLKRAHLERDAEIDWVIGMFGASLMRYDIQCAMAGEGATSYMYGVGVPDDHQQFAQFTKQHHQSGNTTSDLLFKNVLRDHAITNYAGLIKVEKNANGTNAYQANRNLVLSDKVRCDTKPILEIESNQLRCTHGATVGRLDEQQLFYLRSRGLPEAQARDVLIEAFLEPVLARIRVDPVRKEFAERIHHKLNPNP